MNCNNKDIHNTLIEIDGYIICPFCDEKISENETRKRELCCDKQNLIKDNGLVCTNCGVVDLSNNFETRPYINFHENKFKFRNKTIYNRRYYIQQILNSYDIKQLSWCTQDKIMKIFKKINEIQKEVNNNRKRIISLHYILRRIFKMMKLEYKFIPQSKHVQTIKSYQKWWKSVMKLIGKDINNIINK